MTTLAFLVLLGTVGAAQAPPDQAPRTFTPTKPPRPGEQTVLNARVVAVDAASQRITVRGVDVKADGGRDESYLVAMPAASRLRELRPGMEVFLILRGQTVVDVRRPSPSQGRARGTTRTGTAAPGAAAAPRPAALPPGPTAPRAAVTPAPGTTPQPLVSPQPIPVPPINPPPGAVPIGIVYVATPSPVPQGTPFPTPRPQPTPIPVGAPPSVPTPVPVLVPAPPPSPTPTPPPPS